MAVVSIVFAFGINWMLTESLNTGVQIKFQNVHTQFIYWDIENISANSNMNW